MVRNRGAPNPVAEFMQLVDARSEFSQLVLSRRPDESIVISDIETGQPIAVISINEIDSSGYNVSLGCHAPMNVSIDRANVYLSKLLEREDSGLTQDQEGAIRKWLSQWQVGR